MTSQALSQPQLQPQPPSPWLYGPGRDVFFGYGFAYLLSVPLFVWYFVIEGRTGVPAWFTLLLSLVVISPHFGATVLRAYERREDRRRYAIFTVWITLALGLLYVGSLYSALLGSFLVTLYVSWTPWHFSGQNYGLGLMYLRRRGIAIEPPLKRAFYASFVLSAVLAFLSIHMASSSLVYSRGSNDPAKIFSVIQLGIPTTAGFGLAALLAVGWLGCLGFVAWRLMRRTSGLVLAPIGLLVLMQSLWFAMPALAATTRIFDLPPEYNIPFVTIWMSAAHAAQYLWVTSYYARRENPERGHLVYLGRAILVGAALLAPTLLFVPGVLGGSVPNAAGISVLALAMMNLHHFFLDGAIWKLRDGRVARILLRSAGDATGPDTGSLRRIGGWALGLTGAAALVLQAYSVLLFGVVTKPGVELAALDSATRQLAWLGADEPVFWAELGSRYEAAGEPNRALAAYGRYFKSEAQPDPRVAERALRLILAARRPALLPQADGLARYLVARLGDERSDGHEFVAAVAAARGDAPAAVEAAERALEIARRRGDANAVARIARSLSSYRQVAESSTASEG